MGKRIGTRIGFNDPLSFMSRFLTWLFSHWVKLTYPFAKLGRHVSLHHTCDLLNTGLMQIGDNVTVHRDVWLHAHPNSAGQSPVLTVGDRCFIGRRCHIAAKNQIIIEPHVLFAASVLVQDHGHNFTDIVLPIRDQGVTEGGKIRIGQGSWIGQGAVLICDAGELALGRNCVVAANSVVTRSAGDYSVLSGNPARVVKQYDPTKGAWVLGSAALSMVGGATNPIKDGKNSEFTTAAGSSERN